VEVGSHAGANREEIVANPGRSVRRHVVVVTNIANNTNAKVDHPIDCEGKAKRACVAARTARVLEKGQKAGEQRMHAPK